MKYAQKKNQMQPFPIVLNLLFTFLMPNTVDSNVNTRSLATVARHTPLIPGADAMWWSSSKTPHYISESTAKVQRTSKVLLKFDLGVGTKHCFY